MPDAAWQALVANPRQAWIAADAPIPVNTIVDSVAPGVEVATFDPGKALVRLDVIRQEAGWLALVSNTNRLSIDVDLAVPVNAIAHSLEL